MNDLMIAICRTRRKKAMRKYHIMQDLGYILMIVAVVVFFAGVVCSVADILDYAVDVYVTISQFAVFGIGALLKFLGEVGLGYYD